MACLFLALAAGTARADDDIAALRGRLDQIKALVADFEIRLNALEAVRSGTPALPQIGATAASAVASAPAPVTPPSMSALPPAAADTSGIVPRAQWRRVQSGLTMDEVHGLIGTPTKTFELAGKRVWYYYYPAVGAGSVFFDTRGRASSVQRPASVSW